MIATLKVFKSFNLFGSNVHLLVDGGPSFQTKIGAFMTLTMFSILAYSCNSFILEMNQGKNALLNQKQVELQLNEGFSFNSTEFVFAVGLLNGAGQPIPNQNEEIFSIQFYTCNKSLSETNCFFFPSVICGDIIEEFIQVQFNITKELNVPEDYKQITYCLDQEWVKKQQIIRLQGSQRMDNFTLMGAVVQKCTNSTDSQKCASKEKIDQLLTKANLYYTYSSYQFNKELNEFPYEKVQNLDVTTLYPQVMKYIKILYQYSESTLEYNPFYFFPKFEYPEAVEYDQTLVDVALNFDNDSTLAQIEINLNVKKKINHITYQTLMDVAAKIGGFFTILRICFTMITFPFQSIIYRLYLINKTLRYQYRHNKMPETNKEQPTLTLTQIIFNRISRKYFFEHSQLISKLLDIKELLYIQLKIMRQVEINSCQLKKDDYVQSNAFDEIILQVADSKSISGRSINQERYCSPPIKLPKTRITSQAQ